MVDWNIQITKRKKQQAKTWISEQEKQDSQVPKNLASSLVNTTSTNIIPLQLPWLNYQDKIVYNIIKQVSQGHLGRAV